jgi:large subunit ribosomal protein LP0
MERKKAYFERLVKYCDEYSKILIVEADNVGSNQLQKIRIQLRGKAAVLMGKNTMIRKVLKDHSKNNAKLLKLLPLVRGNIGFIFTNGDLNEIRDIIAANKVGAPAKAGSISPIEVVVPAGNTGQEPTKTSFFQALNIPTKITKGTVEIIADVKILSIGDKVGSSEAALLSMLNIKPFSYGLKVISVYDDGSVFEPKVLDLTDEDLAKKFFAGIANVASLSLALGLPNQASLPHMFVNAYKNVLSVALETEYSFPAADRVKDMLANPGAFAVAQTTTTTTTSAPVVESKKEEVKSESEGDMGFSLFD